ncbi:hypothetical protein MNBD_ALPHA11-1316 [hydrothermal vent metagenome]|uniref:Uncharacterized protein n=1 Tax=hydrothermal vent metagenome TaxID=652676 RepID=A0A3B0TWS4_9ZZZZ
MFWVGAKYGDSFNMGVCDQTDNASITKVDQSVKNRATLSVEQEISRFNQVV